MSNVVSSLFSRLAICTRPAAWLLAALVASPLALPATEPAFQVRKTVSEADFGSATSHNPMVLSGLSAAGDLAGYFTVTSKAHGVVVTSPHSFVWQDATGTALDLNNQLGASTSIATCMSPSGAVGGVAWEMGTLTQVGYVWRNGVLTTFPSPDGSNIDAVVGVNDSGDAIGTYFGAGSYKRAFLWNGTNSVDLGDFGDPSGSFVWPASINNGGEVVGTVYDFGAGVSGTGTPSDAFFWQNGVMSLVDPSGDHQGTAALGINGLGQTACSYRSHLRDGGGGFVWEDGVLTELGSLGGGGTVPFAITFAGTVVGTAYGGDDVLHVFSWQSGVMTDLGGVALDAADTAFQLTGVNTAGNVVGFVTGGGATKAVWRSVGAAGSLLHDVAAMLPGGTGFVADDTPGTSILVNEAGRTACSGFLQGTPAVLLLLPDTDGDGMPDEWETAHGLNPLDPGDASADPDGDGLSNLQEYQQGTDPTDPFQSQAPVVTALSGTPQTGSSEGLAPEPLVAQVSNVDGTPLAHVPVTFSTSQGALKASSTANPTNTLTLQTDANGLVQAFFVLPTALNTTCTVTATASNGKTSQSGQATFTLSTDDGTGTYDSPFDLTVQATANADDSGTLTWSHHLDGVTGFRVSRHDELGTHVLADALPRESTSFTVPPSQQGVMGHSKFKVEALISGGTNFAGGGSSGGGLSVMETTIMPAKRYAVIDMGLTDEVGTPEQINKNGTVLLVNPSGTISRWRQGNLEQIDTLLPVSFVPSPWLITFGEDCWPAVLDDMDNVIVNEIYQQDGHYAVVHPPGGPAFSLAPAAAYVPNGNYSYSWVYCGEGGKFYGDCTWSEGDPNSTTGGVIDYLDGARWEGANSDPTEYGSFPAVFDPVTNRYVFKDLTCTPVSVRNGMEIRVDHGDHRSVNGCSLGGAEMIADGTEYAPYFQNSRGAVLASPNDDGISLSYVGNVDGAFNVFSGEPFFFEDVWGFNAAQIAVADAQGNMNQVDAPQLVGRDSDYSQTPFVYEENPLSRTYVEKAVNAQIILPGYAMDDGGTPADTDQSRATTNEVSDVEVGKNWTVSSVTAINDIGMMTAVGHSATGSEDDAIMNGDADTSSDHALVGIPVTLTVTTTALGNWDGSSLNGYKMEAKATIPAAAAVAANITMGGIWRDTQSTDRLNFIDGSILICGCPWLADTGSYQVAGTADAAGNLVWKNGDLPSIGTVTGEVSALSTITEVFNSRWFLVLTINSKQITVLECDASYTNVASQDYTGATPAFKWTSKSSKSNPLIGVGLGGNAPNPKTPPAARASPSEFWSAANSYIHTNSNWRASGGGDAQKYQPVYH